MRREGAIGVQRACESVRQVNNDARPRGSLCTLTQDYVRRTKGDST